MRPGYYDSLDTGSGHIKNAALSMGELSFGINSERVYVRELNIVKIESLRRNYTNLPGDRNHSWYLEVGSEQKWLNCDSCLSAKARSGYGYASSLFHDRILIAGFIGAGFLGKSFIGDNLYASGLSTVNLNFNDRWAMRLEAERRQFSDGNTMNITSAQARWQFSSQMDLRLSFAHDRTQELGLSMGMYW